MDVTTVERGELLRINNPHYQMVIDSYALLKGVEMTDQDSKPRFLLHVMLGANDYAAIKTSERPRVVFLGNLSLRRLSWGGLLCRRELRLTTQICY